MNYKAEITIATSQDKDKIIKLIEPEEKKHERSFFEVEETEKGIKFKIEAKDPTALRATINTIMQILIIHKNLKK